MESGEALNDRLPIAKINNYLTVIFRLSCYVGNSVDSSSGSDLDICDSLSSTV